MKLCIYKKSTVLKYMYGTVCMYVRIAKFLLLDRFACAAVHSGAAFAGDSRQQALLAR